MKKISPVHPYQSLITLQTSQRLLHLQSPSYITTHSHIHSMSSTMDIVRDVRHTRTPMLLRSRIVDTITGNVLFTVMTDARGCRPNEGITYLMDAQNACVASIDWVTHVITVNGVQLSFSCFLNMVSWTHMNSIRYVAQLFLSRISV